MSKIIFLKKLWEAIEGLASKAYSVLANALAKAKEDNLKATAQEIERHEQNKQRLANERIKLENFLGA